MNASDIGALALRMVRTARINGKARVRALPHVSGVDIILQVEPSGAWFIAQLGEEPVIGRFHV